MSEQILTDSKQNWITCRQTWQSLCDHIYDGPNWDDIPEGGVVWCCLDNIATFFKRIQGTGRRYIVVSSYSDYGLCLQAENPPYKDLVKYADLLTEVHGPKIGYDGITIQPRCRLENCNQSHKYSIKCYAITHATFPCIPDEVAHWFCTNCGINDDRITPIPFGLAENIDYSLLVPGNNLRQTKVYINFQSHTVERMRLKRFFDSLDNMATVVDKAIPFEQYITDLQNHMYVLCPAGNGLDCYRTIEAIACGAIPIVPNYMPYTRLNLPVLYYSGSRDIVDLVKNSGYPMLGDSAAATSEYWQDKLAKMRKKFL